MFSRVNCAFCQRAKRLFENLFAKMKNSGEDPRLFVQDNFYQVIELDTLPRRQSHTLHDEVMELSQHFTVPAIFIGGKLIGGYTELAYKAKTGELQKLLLLRS